MTLAARIGLAVVRPGAALAVAGDRRHAGRSGSDLLIAIAILLVATQLRWLVSAVWLGAAVDASLGVRALVHVLTRTLTVDLGFLVIGAAVILAGSGPRRDLGRAFDLACVAALPLVLVHLVAQVVADASAVAIPVPVQWVVETLSYSWMVGLVVLAIVVGRRAVTPTASELALAAGRRAGWIVTAVAGVGLALQAVWLVRHVDQVRPLVAGAAAPAFALHPIGPSGALGDPVRFVPGKVTVIDFWATWCGPCLHAMPALDAFARRHPEIDVFAINLDDPGQARALFDEAHYVLTLLADDGATSERYGVTVIPHTVLIDRTGRLRKVSHGGGIDLEAEVRALGP